ncbi:hypothetical protein BFL43_07680 [Williamsia sp. 1135]|nr:hypothetical protein BFL43_07680 [Williamsia sp. 1135]
MIDPSIEALVVASRKRPDLVGPILMSSFSRRRERVAEDQTLLPMRAWYELAKVPLADHLLSRMGAPWPPAKDIILSVDWVSSMRWGLDHFTYSARLLRSDLTVGGVLSVRMLIERWTLNVAHHHKIHRRSDEADSDFITRA